MIHMWGRGIAPVPTNYFRDPFRLGRVPRTGHHHWDCRLDACEYSELRVWKPAVANWDGGDAPSHVSFWTFSIFSHDPRLCGGFFWWL